MTNKLELNWYGKEKQISIEPRILIESKELSNTKYDSKTENILIHGDNLIALKALEKEYAGKVKCIYIDPPYNTGSAFEHYDDNVEHSTWLSLMKPRIELLRSLLSDDGSIWISIDADESHYLKVLVDEIFGRNNFIDEVVWQRSYSPINLKKTISRCHDNILIWAKNKSPEFEFNKLPRTIEANNRYKNLDNDPRGVWKSADLSVGPAVESNIYEITTPTGRSVFPPKGRSWVLNKDRYQEFLDDNRIWFGATGNNVPSVKRFLSDTKQGIVAMTLWKREEVGDSQEGKREILALELGTVFDTPKQERLIERILHLATKENDLVLDSFLGSGTTAAVAHKMNRRWIGIEMGDHVYSHSKVRLDKVIDGTDKGGISKIREWQGGGGYKFYELAPTLINFDDFGEPIINKEYSAEMLASAIALHEGFTYEPSIEVFWKQSKANEKSFLFVTTRFISKDYLNRIKETMQDDEYLIIACKSFDSECNHQFRNIKIKKIPNSLLTKCEFGKVNYNLNIVNPPVYDDEEDSHYE